MKRALNNESCNKTLSYFSNEVVSNAHNGKKIDLGILSTKKKKTSVFPLN